MEKACEDKLKILYFDEACKATDSSISINRYFFPEATERIINFDEIETISLESGMNEIHKWNPSMHNVNNWFPLDGDRKNRGKFLSLHLKGKKTAPSFCPLDASKLFNILKKHFELHGNQGIKFVDNSELDNLKHSNKLDENRAFCFGEESKSECKEPLSEAKLNLNMNR